MRSIAIALVSSVVAVPLLAQTRTSVNRYRFVRTHLANALGRSDYKTERREFGPALIAIALQGGDRKHIDKFLKKRLGGFVQIWKKRSWRGGEYVVSVSGMRDATAGADYLVAWQGAFHARVKLTRKRRFVPETRRVPVRAAGVSGHVYLFSNSSDTKTVMASACAHVGPFALEVVVKPESLMNREIVRQEVDALLCQFAVLAEASALSDEDRKGTSGLEPLPIVVRASHRRGHDGRKLSYVVDGTVHQTLAATRSTLGGLLLQKATYAFDPTAKALLNRPLHITTKGMVAPMDVLALIQEGVPRGWQRAVEFRGLDPDARRRAALLETATTVSPHDEPAIRNNRSDGGFGFDPRSFVSPDQKRVGCVVASGEREDIRINGKTVATVDRVLQLRVTDTGYFARIREDDKEVVLVDGVRKTWPEGAPRLVYAIYNDSLLQLYLGEGRHRIRPDSEGGWRIYCGVKQQGSYRKLHSITLTPDRSKLAFAATTKQGERVVVVDGVETPALGASQTSLQVSNDGKLVVYIAVINDGQGKPLQSRVVVNGKAQARYEKVLWVGISPSGRRWIYAGLDKKRGAVVVDGKLVHRFKLDDRTGSEYASARGEFSRDSRRWWCSIYANANPQLITDGGLEATHVYNAYFSPDAREIAYVSHNEDIWRIYRNDRLFLSVARPSPPFDFDRGFEMGPDGWKRGVPIRLLGYSEDGRHLVYVVEINGRSHLCIDDTMMSSFGFRHLVSIRLKGKDQFHVLGLRDEKEGWIRVESRIRANK